MNPFPRLLLSLAAGLLVTACAGWEERQQGMRDTDRARENDRRLCMTQPPAQVEACLQRMESEYIARENMRKVEPRTPPATATETGADAAPE